MHAALVLIVVVWYTSRTSVATTTKRWSQTSYHYWLFLLYAIPAPTLALLVWLGWWSCVKHQDDYMSNDISNMNVFSALCFLFRDHGVDKFVAGMEMVSHAQPWSCVVIGWRWMTSRWRHETPTDRLLSFVTEENVLNIWKVDLVKLCFFCNFLLWRHASLSIHRRKTNHVRLCRSFKILFKYKWRVHYLETAVSCNVPNRKIIFTSWVRNRKHLMKLSTNGRTGFCLFCHYISPSEHTVGCHCVKNVH